MRRREFITLLGGAAAAWPLDAWAQQRRKVWRIGTIGAARGDASSPYGGFLQGMYELGYIEGKDFVGEYRSTEGQYARLPDLVAELVRLKIDVITTGIAAAVRPLQQATRTIPIVLVGITDPIGNGFVASLARPGGNTTGLAASYDDTAPKQLELLSTIVPNPSRVGFLGNPETPNYSPVLNVTQDAARKAGISLMQIEARNLQEIENAFATFGKERVPAVMVASDAVFFGQRERLVELALQHRLPTMFAQREYTEAGGLMSYGQSQREFYRSAATFVHKIMRGAKPADLPVEQPTRFHLVINRKNADMLGVTIPALLYIFADDVIE
jgi:putative ABC transport system substrate-binding protein